MAQNLDLVVHPRLVIPAADLQWSFSRSAGPGGQNVNKLETAVELSLDIEACTVLGPFQKQRLQSRLAQLRGSSVLRIRASEHRSQYKNRCLALEKMAEALRDGLKPDPKPRRATKPSKASTRKRLEGKKLRGHVKRNRQQRPRLED